MSEPIPRSQGQIEPSSSESEGTPSEKPQDAPASPRNEAPPPEPPDEPEEPGGKMTFLEHLDELRRRLIYGSIALGLTVAGSFFFREQIFDFLQEPILRILAEVTTAQGRDITDYAVGERLIITKPTEAFTIYLKVCLVSGFFLASPVIAWQIWAFISPGLYRREKLYAIPFLFFSTLLFLAGGAFAFYVILPAGLRFLLVEMGQQFTPLLTAADFFNLEVIILVGMGVVFQMPIIIAFLSLFGLVSPGFLWKNFRYAILIITVIAAVVSPTPDALNLFFWAGPMILLYIISIGISWIFQFRRRRRERA